jgi:hypothetical protein
MNPDLVNRSGITRRLLMINSVSVRKEKAPISNIHRAAGKPNGTPTILRNVFIISSFVTGFGAATLITPLNWL